MKEGKSFEMAIKIHLRRFTSVFLCCLLVFCSLPVQVHASDPVTAASLAITGGQLAGAGLSGEAALSLAGPVGAVVGITLGALGVNAYVSQAAQEAGKTRTRFVLDKLVIWGAQAGYTQEQLYTKIAQGISVAADGTIQLADDVALTIQQFGNWLFEETSTGNELVVPEIATGDTSVQIGNYTLAPSSVVSIDSHSPYMLGTIRTGNTYNPYTQYFNVASSASVGTAIYCALLQGQLMFMCSSDLDTSRLRIQIWNDNGYSNWASFQKMASNPNYSFYSQAYYIANPSIPSYNVSWSTFLSDIYGQSINIVQQPASDEVFIGTPESWTQNKDVLNPSAEDTSIVLNPDLLNPIIDSLADGQQATMSIIDYLQALQDAWDHALDDLQTAIGTITDSLTGIQEQIAIPQTAVENPSITNPSVAPDTTPILNPSDVNPGTAITGLSFDLTNIFPFCIPFDIYAALNLLDAEPVAPSYHVHLEWPYNIIIDFTIDLSPFDQVAAVARTMETLIFIIGLAVMTRSMFIRG